MLIYSRIYRVIVFTQEKRDQKQDEREKNYQEIISKITDKLSVEEVVKRM